MTPLTAPPSERGAELDRAFEALGHTMRRRVLVAVSNEAPRREDEFETRPFRPDDSERETVAVELRHSHLPRLDEAGFVDWHEDSGTVTRGEDFAEIRPLLELLDDHREELPGDWP